MNIVSTIMQSLTPEVIAKIASMFGLDRGAAQKAVQGGIPAILAGLTNLASSSDGARQLSNAVMQQQPNVIDQLQRAGGSQQSDIAEAGAGALSGLLGASGVNALANAIGKFSGIGGTAGKSLLGVLAPVVTGALGNEVRQGGLDAGGLASLLNSQKNQIADAMPAGLAKMLGSSGLLDSFEGTMRRGADATYAAADRFGDSVGQPAYAAARHGATASTWPYWLAGLIALSGLAWYLLGDHDRRQVAERAPAPATETTTAPAPGSSNLGIGVPDLSALSAELTTSVNSVVTTLEGIRDPATAQAALPKLAEANSQFDKINALAKQLPTDAKAGLASMAESSMPAINQLCDKILATPAIADVSKPAIDMLRTKLDALTKV